MEDRDRHARVIPASLRAGLALALTAAVVVLIVRLLWPDLALVAVPVVTILAVLIAMDRMADRQERRLRAVRRELRQRIAAHDQRQRTLVRGETERLYGQLEALAAIRDTLDGRTVVPRTTDWAASADLLRELLAVLVARRPKVVVEAGSGTSTVVIAACLERFGVGHIWSLEHLSGYAHETRDLLAASGLQDRATIVDAPLVDLRLGDDDWSWYDLSSLPETGPIDLLFVDGPPGDTGPLARYPALPMLLDRLAPDAAIIIDDGARPDERATVARWCAEVPGLTVRQLPTQKGGILVTRSATTPTTG